MSLLNNDFDITVEDLISCVIKKLLVYDGNTYMNSKIKQYAWYIPNFMENNIPNIIIDGIDTAEDGKCCVGYTIGTNEIHFKFFNPEYVFEHYEASAKDIMIDDYDLLGKIRYYSARYNEKGWIIININNFINGDLYQSSIMTPSDVSDMIRKDAIISGEWVC